MSKRLLADVLWEAANEHLCPHGDWRDGGKQAYSCWAVEDAAAPSELRAAMHFLCSFGVNPTAQSFDGFKGSKRQGVRYMWLLLAMHVAEDEGLTV